MANLCHGALCREVMTCESREMLGRMIIIDPMTGISIKLPWQTAHHPRYDVQTDRKTLAECTSSVLS